MSEDLNTSNSFYYNNELKHWCNRAGIHKHITFHRARHTNAVLLLENEADIYTISKRLGHREIKTTQVYAKIIDSKMKETSELIPELKFGFLKKGLIADYSYAKAK